MRFKRGELWERKDLSLTMDGEVHLVERALAAVREELGKVRDPRVEEL